MTFSVNNILGKLPIGLKLGGSFVVIVLILAASLFISYADMNQLNLGIVSLYFDRTVSIQDLGVVHALLGQIKSGIQQDARYVGKIAARTAPAELIGVRLKSLGYPLNSENHQELEAAFQHLLALKPMLVDGETSKAIPTLLSGQSLIMVG